VNLIQRLAKIKGPVSLLIDVNRNEILKESYNDLITEIGDDYVLLDTNNPDFHVKSLLIKADMILSVWEFNTESKYYKEFKKKTSSTRACTRD
jgi:hypothetical protein